MTVMVDTTGLAKVTWHVEGEGESESAFFTNPISATRFAEFLMASTQPQADSVFVELWKQEVPTRLFRDPDTNLWSDEDRRLPF